MQSIILFILRMFILLKHPVVRYGLLFLFIYACFMWPMRVFFLLSLPILIPLLIFLVLAIVVRFKVKKTQREFRSKMENMASAQTPPPGFGETEYKDVEIRVVDDK